MASSLFRAASFLHSSRLLPKALNGSSSFLRQMSTYLIPTEEDIVSASLDVIQASPNIKSAKTALDFVFDHPKVKAYPYVDKIRVVTRVLDCICTLPQSDTNEMFGMRCISRSMLNLPEDVKDLTREQVTSRVLEVIKIFPNVDSSKVNEFTHLEHDLGLDFKDRLRVVEGIQWMFRFDIHPRLVYHGFKTVQYTVEYLCSHLHETWVPDQDSRMPIHEDFIHNFRLKEHGLFVA